MTKANIELAWPRATAEREDTVLTAELHELREAVARGKRNADIRLGMQAVEAVVMHATDHGVVVRATKALVAYATGYRSIPAHFAKTSLGRLGIALCILDHPAATPTGLVDHDVRMAPVATLDASA